MTDARTLARWTRANTRARLAYYAQPIATRNSTTPCLAACGRRAQRSRAYCRACEPIWGKK